MVIEPLLAPVAFVVLIALVLLVAFWRRNRRS
jgi:hypothetical protein